MIYKPHTAQPVIRTFAQAKRTTKRTQINLHGKATRLVINDHTADINYHHTVIVRHYADGRCSLDNGGWESSTTKKKINEYAPYGISIYQRNYTWFVTDRTGTYRAEFPIEIDASGRITSLAGALPLDKVK